MDRQPTKQKHTFAIDHQRRLNNIRGVVEEKWEENRRDISLDECQ